MPRKPKAPAIPRRGAAPGTLTSAQILHLLVGDHRYRFKGFRLPAAPFESEAERRRLWEQNKDLLRSYCKKPIPDDVRRELLIPDRIKVWAIAAVPAAEREYGDQAEVEKYFETTVKPGTIYHKARRMNEGGTNAPPEQPAETTEETNDKQKSNANQQGTAPPARRPK